MLGALAILAYAASMMTHEALGHGAYCIASGGHNIMLTAWGEGCSSNPPGIQAAGPGMQCIAGLLTWLVLRYLPRRAVRLRYLCWLYMVFSLFISSGYVAFSGVTGIGDAAVIISGLPAYAVWRGLLILLGAMAYSLSMRATALELKRFVGVDDGNKRLSRLVWIPYLTVGIFACCAGAFNRTMGHGVAVGFAVASSFGSGLGIVWLPDMLRGMALRRPTQTVYLRWSSPWMIASAIVVVAFLLLIGPGLT
jgi:hypothetical protein